MNKQQKIGLFVLAFILLAMGFLVETKAKNETSGAWCTVPQRQLAGVVMETPAMTDARIAQALSGCQRGDILTIPLSSFGGAAGVDWIVIARFCDFDKAMPVANGLLYCVMTPGRQTRG